MKVPSTRGVKCYHCRRAAVNRGLCVHELAVVAAIARQNDQEKNCDDENDNNENERQSVRVDFTSKLPRRSLPCQADYEAVHALAHHISMAYRRRCLDGDVDQWGRPNGGFEIPRSDYIALDRRRVCGRCNAELVGQSDGRNCRLTERRVLLHTLLFGTVKATVCDLECWQCKFVVVFDGRDCAMFATTMFSVYSREIIDFCLYQVAMLGSTFREAYKVSKRIAESPSSHYLRWGGMPLSSNRRTSKHAFSSFLRTVEYPDEDSLTHLLSCRTCESILTDGRKKVSAVAMDGTATGVLGHLPQFVRPVTYVPAPLDTARTQYLISSARVRDFITSFLNPSNGRYVVQNIEVTLPCAATCESVERILFCEPGRDSRCARNLQLGMLYYVCFTDVDLRSRLLDSRFVGKKVEISWKLR